MKARRTGPIATTLVDLHTHTMPGVDDGVAAVEGVATALAALRDQGVETVVATPHLRGSLTLDPENLDLRLSAFDAAWNRLLTSTPSGREPTLLRGVELMLDVPRLDLSDPRLRLGGGRSVLVEFAGAAVPPGSAAALRAISEAGYIPILAHPERYSVRRDAQVLEWRAAGAVMQINAGSLTGAYGRSAQTLARRFLQEGWADCIGSDYHGRGLPALEECARILEDVGAGEQRGLLMCQNPRHLVRGERPLPVPPILAWRRSWFS